jgi:hypothetical protein
LAIGVFLASILAGLAIEDQESKMVNLAVWLPLFWMVICGSRCINKLVYLSNYASLAEADFIEAKMIGK